MVSSSRPNVLKTLGSRGWVDVVGYRDTPAAEARHDRKFLEDLGLRSLTGIASLTVKRIMDLVGLQKPEDRPFRPKAEQAGRRWLACRWPGRASWPRQAARPRCP